MIDANARWSPARARISALPFTSEVWHCGSQPMRHHRGSKFVGEFPHQAGSEPAAQIRVLRKGSSNAESRSRPSARHRPHRRPTSRGRSEADDPPRPSRRARAAGRGHPNRNTEPAWDFGDLERRAFCPPERRSSRDATTHEVSEGADRAERARLDVGVGRAPGRALLSDHASWFQVPGVPLVVHRNSAPFLSRNSSPRLWLPLVGAPAVAAGTR